MATKNVFRDKVAQLYWDSLKRMLNDSDKDCYEVFIDGDGKVCVYDRNGLVRMSRRKFIAEAHRKFNEVLSARRRQMSRELAEMSKR